MPDSFVDIRSRKAWRGWLQRHHATATAVWLVFHKRHTGIEAVAYDAAVEEALCFGWVDSLIKRLDDDRYARKFTPRKADSRWSEANRRRYEKLSRQGLLEAAGRARPPTERGYDLPPVATDGTPPRHVEKALRQGKAWEHFQSLAPSHRRGYVLWVESAKRETTRARRLEELVTTLAAGKTLGMK